MHGERVLRRGATSILNNGRTRVALFRRSNEADVAVEIMRLHTEAWVVAIDKCKTWSEIAIIYRDLRDEVLIPRRILTDQSITARPTSIHWTANVHAIEVVALGGCVIGSEE